MIANHPASGTVLRHEINAITRIQRIAIAFIIGIGALGDIALLCVLIANLAICRAILLLDLAIFACIQRIAIAFIIGIGAFRIGILATRLFATALGFAADLVATGFTAILCVRFAIAVASDEFVRAIAHFDASLRFAFGDALKRCIANFVLFSAILLDFVAIGIARDSCRRILAAGLARVNRARATRAVVASCHRNRHCRNCR